MPWKALRRSTLTLPVLLTFLFRFGVPEAGRVTLRIYDVAGRLVRTLVDRFESAGYHEAVWNGQTDSDAPAASGPYFYRIATPGGEETRKLILLR